MQPLLLWKSNECYILGERERERERVFVALGMQHAMYMRLIVNCDLSGPAIFFHIIT